MRSTDWFCFRITLASSRALLQLDQSRMTDLHPTSSQVIVSCERCGLIFRTLERYVGAQANCPSCGQILAITAQVKITAPTGVARQLQVAIAPPLPQPIQPAKQTPGSATFASGVVADELGVTSVSPSQPPRLPASVPPLLAVNSALRSVPPVLEHANDGSMWGCLLTGIAGFALFSGGVLVLVAAIVAVVPPRDENWAQQKWSGVVCSLLAASAFMLPGAWMWRRSWAMRNRRRITTNKLAVSND